MRPSVSYALSPSSTSEAEQRITLFDIRWGEYRDSLRSSH